MNIAKVVLACKDVNGIDGIFREAAMHTVRLF